MVTQALRLKSADLHRCVSLCVHGAIHHKTVVEWLISTVSCRNDHARASPLRRCRHGGPHCAIPIQVKLVLTDAHLEEIICLWSVTVEVAQLLRLDPTLSQGVWPFVKLRREYGLVAMISFLVLYLVGIIGNSNLALKVTLTFVYFFTGGYLLSPAMGQSCDSALLHSYTK